MYTTTDSAAQGTRLIDYPAPAGRVIAGAFDDAIETNPIPLYLLSRELNANRNEGPLLHWGHATEIAKRAGVKIAIPDDGISPSALSILVERRKDQAARDLLFARREGPGAAVGSFAAGLAGTLMDPLNLAAGYIPVLGGTRYAATLERAATMASRAGVRLWVGAAEGLVGATLLEAPTLSLRRDLQDDYGLYDSLANIAFGTFASSGLRAVGGAARDQWRGLAAARQEDFLRSIEPSEWAAVRQARERSIERDMATELEFGFERGPGLSPDMVDDFRGARLSQSFEAGFQASQEQAILARAERVRQTDVAIGRQRERMSDAEIERFVEAERKMRAEAAAPGADDRVLLDAAGLAERKFREMDLAEVKDRLKRGEGLIIVPGNNREIAAAISDETHAQAIKVVVAQAVEGRRIDADPVVRRDPVFGPQRMSDAEVRRRAVSNMSPEQRVGASQESSRVATLTIEESTARPKAEAPAAKTGAAKSPPPRGRADEAAGAEVIDLSRLKKGVPIINMRDGYRIGKVGDEFEVSPVGKNAPGKDRSGWVFQPFRTDEIGIREFIAGKEKATQAPKSPELAELEARLAADYERASPEERAAWEKIEGENVVQKADDYERAWKAIAACFSRRGE